MKYKKIILFFCIALPASILMRVLQLAYTVDTATGFLKPEYKTIGYNLLILIFACSLAVALLSFTSHRSPENPPKVKLPLALASFLMAGATAYEIVSESFSKIVKQWQLNLLAVTAFFSVLYFIIYGLRMFVEIKIPKLCAVLPAVYFIVKIICSFTSISSLALITDNVLLLAAYCVTLLFMICFAKAYNKIDTESNFRKLLAAGLASTVLCFTQAIPHIIINITTGNGYIHTSNSANISVLATGIFVAVFTFSYFSYKNVAVKRHHRPDAANGQELYI